MNQARGVTMELVQMARAGMGVRRFHTMTVLGTGDTVGHHSCGVALLITLLHPEPSANLLKMALTHDLNEFVNGDIPGQVKWKDEDLRQRWEQMERVFNALWGFEWFITEPEARWLRACDLLDLLFFSMAQIHLGNLAFHTVIRRTIEHVNANVEFPAACQLLYDDLVEEWKGMRHV